MEKLSMILWRERGLQETLQFHLEVEQLVLASGRTRWLMRAATDIEAILEQVRRVEIARAVLTDEVGRDSGSAPQRGARRDHRGRTEPWATILSEHRDALVATTREIAELAGRQPRPDHRGPSLRPGDADDLERPCRRVHPGRRCGQQPRRRAASAGSGVLR